MARPLFFVGLLLIPLSASDPHQNPSHAALKTKPSCQQEPKLVNGRATKQAKPSSPELVTIKVTNVITFDFNNDELKQQLLDNGTYNPKSAEPYHVIEDINSRNRLFVTTPLVKSGIPASLSTIPYDGHPNPPLKPYPSLAMHRTTEDTITDCTKQLVSIAPITVDTCPTGGLVAYSADSFGFRLTVSDLTTGVSKHLQSQSFYPKPGFFFTKAGGPSTYLPFGLAGVAADGSCDGKVYMQAFASNIQDVIAKQFIRDADDGQVMDAITQVALPGELPGTSGPLVVDPKGELLFFPIQDELAIYCWNTSKPHHAKNFRLIVQDKERMQYVSNMQIDPRSGRLWMLTNRFPSFVSNTIDYSDDNYYIMYFSIKGIVC